ncbi:RdgB/HAM1 family non-canonical purine NTP pyrophosphatase [Halochromatium salexigens]|uniref:dITP/XTP pyrophosphatase n=1 Tax=Halochromatium salexigens TaxID=49447 RepID=A0AAJ0XFS0_HALSE|nr:RdgB/HAM1 family non-canonical purine NTP pyrophosphatase [Halochromatium salexigens]MBK5930000.1 non-canonical purine NTP pyrophosphatase, RdgB/HAM1 family [Halochromatium salexigens]
MHATANTRHIVLASNNAGKLREIQALLEPAGLRLLTQGELGIESAEETGLTFVENALLKARHAARRSGHAAIADDSGLEVDALDGAPGIYSARYARLDASMAASGAGHAHDDDGQGSDQANCETLLRALAERPDANRSARFQCVMVYLRHADDPTPLICQGTWEGLILDAPRGQRGFGYDPIFGVPTHGLSAAELEPETKNALSHRGQALRALVAALLERPTPYQLADPSGAQASMDLFGGRS